MKIVCIEEHIVDDGVDRAHEPGAASYMADWGSRVEDKPTPGSTRPHLLSAKAAHALAEDVGAGRLAEMDRQGIDMQVLSFTSAPQSIVGSQALDLVRAANVRMAAIVRANPTRFGGMAMLPWQDPAAAASELERAITELGLQAAMISGRPGDSFLDDERYEPVLAKLHALKVPLYVHPGPPLPQVREPYYTGFNKEVSARLSIFGWGWHNEAGVHVVRMILSGMFDKYPDLQIISGHWGELVPFFLQRMDDMMPPEVTGLSRTITETYKAQVSVTPSGMLTLPHFEFIHKVLGPDRIIYAVDYPYLTMTGARAFLEGLPVSEADKEKIAHGNVERLLRL